MTSPRTSDEAIVISINTYLAMLTERGSIDEIQVALSTRRDQIEKSMLEGARQQACIEAIVNFPTGIQVTIKDTGYRSLDGKVGEVVSYELPPEGRATAYALVLVGKRKRQTPRYMVKDGYVRLVAGGKTLGWKWSGAASTRVLVDVGVQMEVFDGS